MLDPNISKAVGVAYTPHQERAPRVVAKGRRKVAEEIIALAQKHRIPVYQDPAVVELLYTLELDQEIPEELYKVVAEILVFVYRLDGKLEGKENKELHHRGPETQRKK
jgi:flagellar biosynthesis protein